MTYASIETLANGTFEMIQEGSNSRYEVRLCKRPYATPVISVMIISPDKTYHEALYNVTSFANILKELLNVVVCNPNPNTVIVECASCHKQFCVAPKAEFPICHGKYMPIKGVAKPDA